MKEYKVVIKKGNGYFDPQLNININSPHGSQKITEKEIIEKPVGNLNFAVKTGVVNVIDMDTKDKVIPKEIKNMLTSDEEDNSSVEEDNSPSDEEDFDEVEQLQVNSEDEEESDSDLELFDSEGNPRCQAITASGEQCSNKAVFPENDPQYCHIKSHQKMYNPDLEDEE